MKFFELIFYNPIIHELCTKLVEAPSPQYIKKNKSEFVGRGMIVCEVDIETYKNAKTKKQADKILERIYKK